MEERLAIRIRLLRKCGLIFETWMLAVEGLSILNRLYPLKFPREDGVDVDGTHSVFKFSRTWQQSFFKRHKFAYRRIGTRKNAAALKVDWIQKIEKYHLTVRALQLSEMNDPEYGFTKPEYETKYRFSFAPMLPLQLKTREQMRFMTVLVMKRIKRDSAH